MPQAQPPAGRTGKSREGITREPILDRKTVLTSLQHWLDTVIPVTALNLSFKIHTESASPAAPIANASKSPVPGGSFIAATAKAALPGPVTPEEFEKPEIVVVFDGPDKELLLEHGAELLLALEYLAVRSLRLEPPFFDRIRFDSGDFRALRIAELTLSAKVAAQRVRETRQPFRLNPMAARERRIVHLALKDIADIRTSSEGIGEERQVVIMLADAKK
jgi:predicted RNA-binding protein Jag